MSHFKIGMYIFLVKIPLALSHRKLCQGVGEVLGRAKRIDHWLPGEGVREDRREMVYKALKATFGGDGHVHYFDCDSDFTSIHIGQNLSKCIL